MSKKILSFLVAILFVSITYAQVNDPILFKVDGEPVLLSEFKYIYEKNNRDKADYSEATLTEYLDLYKKFKLKVRKARDMKLDTVPVLKSELAGYRKQLAKSYLVDNEVSEKLVKEVYERQHKDRKIAHIFFSIDKYAPAIRIDAVRKKANDTYNELIAGGDFSAICKKVSEDKSSANNEGDLGFFAIPMPDGFYDMETVMCELKPGEISKPVRSRLGFHIIKLVEDRTARGEIEIAQILVRKKLKNQTLLNAKNIIDSVYSKLESGIAFEALAKQYSQDKKTAKKGGNMGFFGIGKFDQRFEDAAFNLKNDGDYSKIVETKIGYHIIKRVSKQDNSNYNIVKKRIKGQIAKDSRFEMAKKTLIERIKKDAGFILNQELLDKFIAGIESDFYTYAWKSIEKDNSVLISFGEDVSYSIKTFSDYCRSNARIRVKFSKKMPIGEAVNSLLESFIDDKAIVYEEKSLEAKYPDFKSLMREYEEGILLFEATKLNVWDKASNDTLGLQSYFESNRNNYYWDERANVEEFLIASTDKKVLKKIRKCAKKRKRSSKKILKKFNKKEEVVELREDVLSYNSKDMAGLEWKLGAMSEMKVDESNKRSSFKRLINFEKKRLKTLKEARGYVIADYQDDLELKWVNKLRAEYPIELNKEVFNALIRK